MTRRAQIAQHPTLDQLTDATVTFTEGEVFSITLPRVSWVAMGRPLDLQVIVTPRPPEGVPISSRAAEAVASALAGMTDEERAEYERIPEEIRTHMEMGL